MPLALCLQIVSQAPQHYIYSKTEATCDGCFTCQSICLVISLYSSMSRAILPQEFSKVDVSHWHIPLLASHSTFHILLQVHWLWWWYGMCLTVNVISWGSPAEGMGDCFHHHCHAGSWDHIGCTVFMDGGYTLLDGEASPWLVGDWVISVHYEILRFTVFLNEKLDFWFCFTCWPVSAVLSQVLPKLLGKI